MKSTIAEALQEMRRLLGTDAGRLRGVPVPYHLDQITGLDTLPAPWGAHLTDLIEARRAGVISADTPHYVVYSDGLPVAWATVHAAVHTPDVPMSPVQAKHQRQAAAVPADLDRNTLNELADERDQREGRPDAVAADDEAMIGALRVAPLADPTRTRWVRVGADLDAARHAVAQATRCAVEQTLIVTAVGYGHHGYHAHRLSLELVCAMQAVIAVHPVSLSTVGTWIDHEHGLAGQVDPRALPQQFTDAYIGQFGSRTAYARHRMTEQGWTELLRSSGMEPYFDLRRHEQHLFSGGVAAIDLDGWQPGRGIEVFHRRPATT
ncbi:MAG: hypothetical protein QOE61_3785 [Micromonosporaceae bacterium]|jgi:hypothetical protein|nr:hypothetical protein [Micromonosporaceae bacterium]